MVKALRAALVLGAGYIAARYLTKKPVLTDENIQNGAMGAVAGMVGLPKLEQLVKGELPEGQNTGVKGIAYGAAAGAAIVAAARYLSSKNVPERAAAGARAFYDKHLKADG